MSFKSTPYLPLNDSDLDGREDPSFRRSPQTWWRLLAFASFLSICLNIAFAYSWLSEHRRDVRASNQLYSPAQDIIEYHSVKFHSGFGKDIPIYDRPPSKEVDEAWAGLYEFACNKIPREQARLLANKTYPVLDQEGQYMIALDVFHQLHCLNQMRKAMYPEYYEATPEGIHTPHMAHCISSLRQSLMCSADVTPIVWQWSERSKKVFERSDVVHTCRRFDKIQDWAQEHFLDHQQDMSVYIEDDLETEAF